MNKIIEIITAQQQGHENDDVFMVGEQLKDMANQEPFIVEILTQDLTVTEMSIAKAAEKIKDYADKNRGSRKCFCVTPIVAEGILREFYGLPPKKANGQSPLVNEQTQKINLSDFL